MSTSLQNRCFFLQMSGKQMSQQECFFLSWVSVVKLAKIVKRGPSKWGHIFTTQMTTDHLSKLK